MADIYTKSKRSEIMSRIRSEDTGLERTVYQFLSKEGIRFRRHYGLVPGKPDIAIPSKKKAVFIDGDFWHGWRFSSWKHKLTSEFWREKIAANMRRDRKNFARLRRDGWRVMRVWEHELATAKGRGRTLRRLRDFLM